MRIKSHQGLKGHNCYMGLKGSKSQESLKGHKGLKVAVLV